MSLINIKFSSRVLKRSTDINVIIPQKPISNETGMNTSLKSESYKTLILLHGLSDDNTCWMRRTSIERYATEHGIAVIMPGGDRSFYTNMVYGDDFYTYISEEVPAIAREYLPLSEKREDNFIAGLSMGGYGALKIGMKNPDRYAACAGLSSVADVELFMNKHAPDCRRLVFGDKRVPESEDLFFIAEELNKSKIKPRIFMGVGTEDFMYEENTRLRDKFKSLDFDFTYRESAGTHNWGFWDEYIRYVLQWMFEK